MPEPKHRIHGGLGERSKPPPFQGGNHEFKSRTRHQYARIAKLVMHLTFNQEILSVRA